MDKKKSNREAEVNQERKLERYLKAELRKYRLWSFLEQHGSERSKYQTGYYHALQSVLSKMNKVNIS
ncbi:hypothetical protein JOD82_001984 [Paenibacillus sp. 1182]|uniref:hypothetical protein n=1 Tax=Paenibacillus sp. 1182 TaxID=2806565 RepID=UPI001AE1B700|nr:hypothetical protein [Paenibacillus sp. 1182]MBP1308964.1 hypothetical protein [Paenibacillus sp. 1182]